MTPQRLIIRQACAIARQALAEKSVSFPKYRWLKRVIVGIVSEIKAINNPLRRI